MVGPCGPWYLLVEPLCRYYMLLCALRSWRDLSKRKKSQRKVERAKVPFRWKMIEVRLSLQPSSIHQLQWIEQPDELVQEKWQRTYCVFLALTINIIQYRYFFARVQYHVSTLYTANTLYLPLGLERLIANYRKFHPFPSHVCYKPHWSRGRSAIRKLCCASPAVWWLCSCAVQVQSLWQRQCTGRLRMWTNHSDFRYRPVQSHSSFMKFSES